MAVATIVFADLTGSTGIFETLGNSRATDVVTRITQALGHVGSQRGGRVIKYLGDAVLLSFADNDAAVHAAIDMQRQHREQQLSGVARKGVQIQIGLARGEVVEQDSDCFGDAVNMASRLSDLAGADQILVTDSVIAELPLNNEVRFLNLGPMTIRGKTEPLPVYRLEWQHDESSEFMTVAGDIDALNSRGSPNSDATLTLSWLDSQSVFHTSDTPIFLGRGHDVQFPVHDPRVSRLHAKIDHRGEVFVLEDISSFGTTVRFAGSDKVLSLRRQECVLLDRGEIALGGPFDDFSTPVVAFQIRNKQS